MALGCPFCGAPLDVPEATELGPGETGGVLTMTDHSCAVCGTIFEHRLVEKLRRIEEHWSLGRAGAAVSAALRDDGFPPHACVRCDGGTLVAAVPLGLSPARFRPQDQAELVRTVVYVCAECDRSYLRSEKGPMEAPNVGSWSVLEGDRFELLPSPPSVRTAIAGRG